MRLKILHDDLTRVRVDALAFSANPEVCHKSGTDNAVHVEAGPELLQAREKIGKMQPGQVEITGSYRLQKKQIKYIIHIVAIMWQDGEHNEKEKLRECYRKAFELALKNNCKSIAIPLLGTGYYHFPLEIGVQIALDECFKFIWEHNTEDMEINLVTMNPNAIEVLKNKGFACEANISYGEKCKIFNREYEWYFQERPDLKEVLREKEPKEKENLEIDMPQESFNQRLQDMLINAKLTEPEIYKAAKMQRGTFNNLKSGKNSKPTKETVCKLIIGMQLCEDDAKLLLRAAGYTFTTQPIDQIIMKCVETQQWDTMKIDEALLEAGQKAIFSEK